MAFGCLELTKFVFDRDPILIALNKLLFYFSSLVYKDILQMVFGLEFGNYFTWCCCVCSFLAVCRVLNISDKVRIINWEGIPKLPELKTLSRNSTFLFLFFLMQNTTVHLCDGSYFNFCACFWFETRSRNYTPCSVELLHCTSGPWPECTSRALERGWIIYLLACLLVPLCAFLEHFNRALDMLEEKLALPTVILLEFLF